MRVVLSDKALTDFLIRHMLEVVHEGHHIQPRIKYADIPKFVILDKNRKEQLSVYVLLDSRNIDIKAIDPTYDDDAIKLGKAVNGYFTKVLVEVNNPELIPSKTTRRKPTVIKYEGDERVAGVLETMDI